MLGDRFSVENIAEAIGAKLYKSEYSGEIQNILTDSRKLNSAKGTLFIAIKTDKNDGHNYIKSLVERGVRNFLVERVMDEFVGEANFIQVDDALNAFQQLAAYHRKKFQIPVVGITGSNGKTIVKEWAYQLLQYSKNVLRSPKSYNSQIGVPISVLNLNESYELGIFEAGVSKKNEMEKLQAIIQPTIGLFTNIGEAHSEGFANLDEKIDEKLLLFKDCQSVIYCRDHEDIHKKVEARFGISRTFTWSYTDASDIQVLNVQKNGSQSSIEIAFGNEKFEFVVPFVNKSSIENIMHCISLMFVLNLDVDQIAKHTMDLSHVAMRLEQKEGINNCTLINDSYNLDFNSLSIALEFLSQQNQHRKKTVILSDFLQVSEQKELLYKRVANLLEQAQVDKLIGVGEDISLMKDCFMQSAVFFKNTSDFLENYSKKAFQDESILIKGARTFAFERISNSLQQKAHQTVLEINQSALLSNYNYFRGQIGAGTKIMAMVKAFSYGTGSYEIANLLQYHNVDYLAVAYADEGIELRNSGITLPIMVLNPEESSFDAMLQYNLEPEIYSFNHLEQFARATINNGFTAETPASIHLKIDTGMHRLGFEECDIDEVLNIIKRTKSLQVKSVFSHLAASDQECHNEFTNNQIAKFERIAAAIEDELTYEVVKHIANSAAINRFPDARLDMVRLGIGLYGIPTNESDRKYLQNVCSLKSIISQVKHVKKGESIGYSRKGFAESDMKIATVAIGYADGLNRLLSNGKGKLKLQGEEVPIIGNICMDMCMIDVTGMDVKENDEVVVFEDALQIEQLANELNTIPYEILTGVSRRVKRVYIHE